MANASKRWDDHVAIRSHASVLRRLHEHSRHVVDVLAAAPPDGLEATLAALTEDLASLDEASTYVYYVAAASDGEVSAETRIANAQAALDAYHQAKHVSVPETASSRHPYDCSMKLLATFPDSLVYEMQGKLYQVSYAISGTDVTISGDQREVIAEFLPAPATQQEGARKAKAGARPASKTDDLEEGQALIVESRPAASLLGEAQLNRASRVIEGTVVITRDSLNGPHGKRQYADAALKQIAKLAEGAPAYANHVAKDQAFKPRDIREMIGRHKNVRYQPDRHRVVSDLHVLEHQAPWVFALAEEMPDVVGNSVVSKGYTRMEGDTEIIEEIAALRSIDLVSDPGATKGLFEHRAQWQSRHQDEPRPHEGDDMKLDDIQAYLKTDKASEVALTESLARPHIDAVKAEGQKQAATLTEQVTALTAKVDEQGKALTEQKAEIATYKAAEALRDKTGRLDKALSESDLAKKYKAAVPDEFRSTLLEADEAKWAGMIGGLVKALDAVAASAKGGSSPRSEPKTPIVTTEGRNGDVPEGSHNALFAALTR